MEVGADIDYAATDNTWPAMRHLDRLLVMAYGYRKDTCHLYGNAALQAAIAKGIGYWYQANPKCKNWFKNDIAKQFYLGPFGLLMQGSIDAGLLAKIVGDLTDVPSMTGANKTALSTSVLYRGVIENSASRVASGVAGVQGEIGVTSGDGIQRDNSFQQHGGILYNGNYGFGFLRDVLWVAAMVAGTQYACSASQIALLRANLLDGTRWMIRRGLLDYSARGREVGATPGMLLRAGDFLPILDHLIVVDPANQASYRDAREAIEESAPQPVSGHRHFWSSDYTAHQRPSYLSSVKMCSKRTIGMERNVNTENLMGYWLPYGLTYTYRRGDEFQYVFPVWDWARLPGVTAPHVEISWADNPTTYTSQSTSFVGGVSDSTYGVTAMDFSVQSTTAKKAWFWFDQEWVALGAGITSTHAKPVYTSVNQVIQKGYVVADGAPFSGSAKALANPKWVLHDSVGYVFPANASVQIQAAPQSGNLKRIFGLGKDTLYKENVFSLWFDHGTSPKGATYQYIVVPGTDQAHLEAYARDIPVTVLSNKSSVQAVAHKTLGLVGLVFHQAGTFVVDDLLAVTVDIPCIVLLDRTKGVVTVSDPNAVATKVAVAIRSNGTTRTQTMNLPSGDNAGGSVKLYAVLDKSPTTIGDRGFHDHGVRIGSAAEGRELTIRSDAGLRSIQLLRLDGSVEYDASATGMSAVLGREMVGGGRGVRLLRVVTENGSAIEKVIW